ncbi:hypothetical protein AAHI00_24080 [Mycobacterium kansasii]
MSLEGGLNGVSAPPVEGSVSVTATDPKDSLAAPHAGSALALTPREIKRCLKRAIAREVYRIMQTDAASITTIETAA